MSDLDAVLGWLHRLDESRAERVVPLRGGLALLSDEFPAAHDLNKLSITDALAGDDLVGLADSLLGGAGRTHRLIAFRTPDLVDSVQAYLLACGYRCESELVMIHSDSVSPPSPEDVEVLGIDERAAVAERSWSQQLPDESPDVWRQLGERIRTVTRAGTATFFARRDSGGSVVSRVDLYERDGIAQIENVFTSDGQRGNGHATALVGAALNQARASRSSIIFLVADANDWPKVLYRRLGFNDAGLVTAWHRTEERVAPDSLTACAST